MSRTFEVVNGDSAFMAWLQSYMEMWNLRKFESDEVFRLYDAWCAGKRIGVLEGKS